MNVLEKPKKHKVIFFLPKPRQHTYSGSLPIALLKLSSMLDRKKFDIKIIAATPKYDYKDKILKESKDALCLAVSVLTGHDILEAIDVIKSVKKNSPQVPVIWGGWHASIFPQQTLESKYADIAVRAQGERTFKELTQRLASKKPLKGLLGISYKQGGKIIHNQDRPFEDLNNFPPIPFDLVDIEDYVNYSDGMRAMLYVSSQGCPFNCKFCSEPLVFKQRWSALSNDRILKDWEFLSKKHNIEVILICDDNFLINEKRVQDFCKKLIAKKLPLKWGRVQGRVRQMLAFKDQTWRLLEKSGCLDIQIGAESGLQEALDFINKQMTVDEVVQLVEKTRKFSIKIVPNLILGLPLPKFKNASKKEIKKMLDVQWNAMLDLFDRCYGEHRDYDDIKLYAYQPYPGNPLYDLTCELGFKAPKSLEEWGVIRNAPWVDKKMKDRIRMMMYFIFPYARDGYEERHIKRFKLVQKLFHKTAIWRWKHRFFALPIDYRMYRVYTYLRLLLTGVTATEHD